jgi:hypothetical protein
MTAGCGRASAEQQLETGPSLPGEGGSVDADAAPESSTRGDASGADASGGGADAGGSADTGSGGGQDAGAGGADAKGDGNVTPPWSIGTGCLFENGAKPTFCDDFSESASAGGRGGDLDDRRWSVARVTGSGNNDFTPFPPTPAAACKSGVSMVTPDEDIVACDAASGHAGQIMTAMSAQNYALLSLRPRQPFDFAGRTGTIVFDVDAVTEGGLSWWTSLYVTDEPVPAGNKEVEVTGDVPRNGFGIDFDVGCASGPAQVTVGSIMTYAEYAETQAYAGTTAGPCVMTSGGSLNHIEVRVSESHIEVWMSDFSPDGGKTFPNFQRVASADVALAVTRGYVHYQAGQRAPLKYQTEFGISPGYTTNYWSGLGFDGPTLGADTGYEIPDALTPGPGSGSTGGPAPNLGYALLTSPQSTVTCCDGGARTPIAPFALEGVDLAGVTQVKLAFTASFTFASPASPTTVGLKYRFNGGTWHAVPLPDMNAATYCNGCPQAAGPGELPGVAFSFPVDATELVQASNTVEFAATSTNDGYPPVLGNIDLLVFH